MPESGKLIFRTLQKTIIFTTKSKTRAALKKRREQNPSTRFLTREEYLELSVIYKIVKPDSGQIRIFKAKGKGAKIYSFARIRGLDL